ncbi:MAG: phospho-sugar mutase [Eubacteriales bacterium]|nr:phospho-sugar mutase [Eubacteriales bacterium]
MRNSEEMMRRWLVQKDLDKDLRDELLGIKDQEDIHNRFYRNLEFGTGGLRGVLGAGTNRMNIYTVRRATQGLADYINQHYSRRRNQNSKAEPSVAIAFDSRINSDRFALEAACVFAANGIKSYLYPELMPTPALSFAVRYYRSSAGVMVTASHNPSQYNGYKVYNEEGCQMTLEAAAEVFSLIEKTDIFDGVKTIADGLSLGAGLPDAVAAISKKVKNLIELISPEVTEVYLDAVKKESTWADCSNLSVVYTPLNGTGNIPVRRILDGIGIKRINIVKEQEQPDGNFPTCPYPNPEKKEALAQGLVLCEKLSGEGNAPDLLLATDPDCDRVGIAVRHRDTANGKDDFVLITGNEVGILLLDYICQIREKAGHGGEQDNKKIINWENVKQMPKDPIAIKTIVTSKMADKVAENYGVQMIDVLTGFKFIGERIGELEAKGEESRYIFGFEESYGYLSGAYVRDKDAVNASMLIAEMTAYYKQNEKTLVDILGELYQKYGYYKNELIDFAFEGAAGMKMMGEILSGLSKETPAEIIGRKVVEFADYQASTRKVIGASKDIKIKPITLPKSDVLEYVLEDGTSIIFRPSGTEPKLKIYLSSKGGSKKESEEIIELLRRNYEQSFDRYR